MQIFPRVVNPGIFEFIGDKLQVDDEWTQEGLVKHFSEILTSAPDLILISAAFEGEECVGFLISIAPPNTEVIKIVQGWAKSGIEDGITNKIFEICLGWARLQGRNSIKTETFRGASLCRKWGFEPYSEILKLDLNKPFYSGVSHGRRQQSKHEEHVDSGTAENISSDLSPDNLGSSNGDYSIHRELGRSIGPDVLSALQSASELQSNSVEPTDSGSVEQPA